MGNVKSSVEGKRDEFLEEIDLIATKLMNKQDMVEMRKLQDPKYCQELVVLTSDLLQRNMKVEDVEFLNERVEQGAEKALIKEKLIYGKKENLANAINTVRAKDKRVVCVGISKFYIKLAHFFAAIASTINLQYNDDSQNKNVNELSTIEEGEMENAQGFIGKTLNAFRIKEGFNEETGTKQMKLYSDVCKIYNDENGQIIH